MTPPHPPSQNDHSPTSVAQSQQLSAFLDQWKKDQMEWKKDQMERDAERDAKHDELKQMACFLFLFAFVLVVALWFCAAIASPHFKASAVKTIGEHWPWALGLPIFSASAAYVVSQFKEQKQQFKGLREDIRHLSDSYGTIQTRVDRLYGSSKNIV